MFNFSKEFELIDLEYESKDLQEELKMLKEELNIKKDMLKNYTHFSSGFNKVKEIYQENEFVEIKSYKDKLIVIKQQNKILSDEFKKLKSDSLNLHVIIKFIL